VAFEHVAQRQLSRLSCPPRGAHNARPCTCCRRTRHQAQSMVRSRAHVCPCAHRESLCTTVWVSSRVSSSLQRHVQCARKPWLPPPTVYALCQCARKRKGRGQYHRQIAPSGLAAASSAMREILTRTGRRHCSWSMASACSRLRKVRAWSCIAAAATGAHHV
jgi:hypothetical protein